MLGKVRIANSQSADSTAVSNIFIDSYLADANDAQIKIYLFLLRAMQAGRATNVSEIADAFNHTEREVKRALTYWEEKGLVRLEYDGKRLTDITLEDLSGRKKATGAAFADPQDLPGQNDRMHADAPEETIPARRRYTADEISAFRRDEALAMTLFAAEQYFKRALNPSEIQIILYAYEELGFPADLLDYLLQYTVEHAKGRYASYMEKTAIAWHSEDVRTLEDASAKSGRTDKRVYEIMRALGLSSNQPTPFEIGYFDRWLNEYCFSMEMILDACRKTVFRTQSHRVEYTDGILSDWHAHGAHTPEEVAALDAAHEKASHRKERKNGSVREQDTGNVDTRNRFNRFRAQEYDFETLKNKIVSNN